jgi:putative ABC transport system permease protein
VLSLFQISLEQGLLYSLIALSISISFKYLNVADLTVDGSFTLGAAIVATTLKFGNVDPYLSLLLAIASGAIAGLLTGLLATKFRTDSLLAGILIMTMLYSVNLRIMGQANISLLNEKTVFTIFKGLFPLSSLYLFFFLGIATLSVLFFNKFFKTEFGAMIRATGDNSVYVKSIGKNPEHYTIMGLMISNGTVALCGGLAAQRQAFADVNMGLGVLVIGLASLIIGNAILPASKHKFLLTLLSAVAGSIGYQFALGIALRLGFAASDLKLITGLIVIASISLSKIKLAKRKLWH